MVRWKKKSFFDALWCCFAVYPSLDVFAPHTGKKNQTNPKTIQKRRNTDLPPAALMYFILTVTLGVKSSKTQHQTAFQDFTSLM